MSGEFSCKNSINVRIDSAGFHVVNHHRSCELFEVFLVSRLNASNTPSFANKTIKCFCAKFGSTHLPFWSLTFINQSCADYCAELAMRAIGNILQL